jgi:uncharacterized phage protein (TIGR02216 family)
MIPAPNPSPKGEGKLFGERAAALAAVAAQLLGWRPDDFWSATPAELALTLGLQGAGEPVAGDELQRLMALFPDKVD